MSALSNIPPHAVLPLSAYDRQSLELAARRADQTILAVDLAGQVDRDAIMARIGRAFGFPDHYGNNLDALYDCLTERAPAADAEQPGFVVIIENIPDGDGFGRSERDALLDVFRDAADFFYDADTAFRVFYSVSPAVG
jgi:RNAse (barnase) inhibitor barstar